MSDNFLRLAKKEIQEELDDLNQILSKCGSDSDISTNGKDIEKHLHKIKGLAPMMGQSGIGEIAKMNNVLLKHVIINGDLPGIHVILSESIMTMKDVFENSNNTNLEQIKSKMLQTFPSILRQ
jgi:chemotaxis protein histidine kinase CheA